MKTNVLFGLVIAFILTSCDASLESQVAATYPDGSPMRVEYFKYTGDTKVVCRESRIFPNGKV